MIFIYQIYSTTIALLSSPLKKIVKPNYLKLNFKYFKLKKLNISFYFYIKLGINKYGKYKSPLSFEI